MLFLSLFAVLIELLENMEKIDNKVSDHSIEMNSGKRFDRDILNPANCHRGIIQFENVVSFTCSTYSRLHFRFHTASTGERGG